MNRFPSEGGLLSIIGTQGTPPSHAGSDGDFATDPVAGILYKKGIGEWTNKATGVVRSYFGDAPSDATSVSGTPVSIGGSGGLPTTVALSLIATSPTAATATSTGINRLAWPEVAGFNLGTFDTKKLYLQRSGNSKSIPGAPLHLWVTTSTSPPADANWITIASWPDASIAPLSYDDTVPNSTFFYYRLCLVIKKTGTTSPFLELDWNAATIVQPYLLKPTQIPGSTRLTWSPPFPVLGSWLWCPSGCDRCVPGAHYAVYYALPSQDGRALASLSVFKSYDGANYSNVAAIPLNQPSPWCDADPSHNIAYFFRAQYNDGTLVDSNGINVSY